MPMQKDQAWFRQKVAELKTELEKLPADRQRAFTRVLEGGPGHQEQPTGDGGGGSPLLRVVKGGTRTSLRNRATKK